MLSAYDSNRSERHDSYAHKEVCSVISSNRFRCVLLLVFLAALADTAVAVSYIGAGGGPSFQIGTDAIRWQPDPSYDPLDYDILISDTTSFKSGFGIEAQFGWEMNPWVDAEGALRYHRMTATDTTDQFSRLTHIELVGFEGGIRFHMRRVITNSTPYIRLGLGSYSPTIKQNDESGTISFDPTLGFYVGAGYMYELTSKIGLDVRATAVFYNIKDGSYFKMNSSIISIAASLLVF